MNRRALPAVLALAALTGCGQVSVTRVSSGDGRGTQSLIYGADGRTVEVRGASVTSWSAGGGLVSARIAGHRIRFDGATLTVDGRQAPVRDPRRVVVAVDGAAISVRVDGRDPFAGVAAEELAEASRTDRFPAADLKSLSIRGLTERVTVRVEPGREDVAVLCQGYPDELGNAAVSAGGRQLCIRGKSGFQPLVTLAVPPGLPLEVSDCNGVDIGDIQARLALASSGSADSRVGRVRGAEITAQGLGRITVAAVSGNLAKITVRGGGDVKIGSVTSARAELTALGLGGLRVGELHSHEAEIVSGGSGGVRIDVAEVDGLTLKSSGLGKVEFASLAGESASLKVEGSGDVVVGRGSLARLSVEASGLGGVTCRASAKSAALSASGAGDVRVVRPGTVEDLSANGLGQVKFIER
jgi:hypothetical protein